MTARLYIVRGFVILIWYLYNGIYDFLHVNFLRINIDVILLFGVVSLIFGFLLKFSKESFIKMLISLFISLFGLYLGLKGLLDGFYFMEGFLNGNLLLLFRSVTSLFFGFLIVWLYVKSLREVSIKIRKYKN